MCGLVLNDPAKEDVYLFTEVVCGWMWYGWTRRSSSNIPTIKNSLNYDHLRGKILKSSLPGAYTALLNLHLIYEKTMVCTIYSPGGQLE